MNIFTIKKGPFVIFLLLFILFYTISVHIIVPELHKYFEKRGLTQKKSKYDDPVKPVVQPREVLANMTEAKNKLRPGDEGFPVTLTAEEEAKMKELWHLNEFNMVAASKVPLDRTLPDFRHPLCLQEDYPLDLLPRTSIIIIFHNEEYHTLLRTATSCFNRSPERLLHEILLVDDFSDRDDVKEPLTDYVKSHFDGKVKVVRTPSRHGLIRAKNFGSQHATGEALVFLDSHCECTSGWLPPLLHVLRENPKAVVQPVIPGIDKRTLAFRSSERELHSQGTFKWNLLFYWRAIPPHDQQLRNSPVDPIRSPTLAGGLFALNKQWWEHLGRYDDGMELWGGENLELSFKTWLCGGQVLYIPCSHVGHIYRGKHPYHWYKPGPDTAFTTNAKRLAEVWLDEYKKFFYEISPNAKNLDMGSIEKQLANKKRLNCKPFKYFITDVVKDMYPPTLLSYTEGGLSPTKDPRLCLDTYGKERGKIRLYGCHHKGGSQAISLTEKSELRIHVQTCLGAVSNDTWIYMTACNGNDNQIWTHQGPNSDIMHKITGQCLTFETDKLKIADCDQNNENQKWKFETYFEKPK